MSPPAVTIWSHLWVQGWQDHQGLQVGLRGLLQQPVTRQQEGVARPDGLSWVSHSGQQEPRQTSVREQVHCESSVPHRIEANTGLF
jgi:hypothetical protein